MRVTGHFYLNAARRTFIYRMGIVRHEKKGDLHIYHVSKNMPDDKAERLNASFVRRSQIGLILKHDADVFTEEGQLLLRFRKNKLPQAHLDEFYENVIHFARNITHNRGSSSGVKGHKSVGTNPDVMSNIIGYFDKFTPAQKVDLRRVSHKVLDVRETRFMMDHPDKFKKILPLIQDIDQRYKQYIPDHYTKQRRKANQTPFRIPGTSFTTITTNVNYRTGIHRDRGDDAEGFGNLVVLERGGTYTGGETCFPQFGVGVDVREGDVLFMDVHQWHGNLPIVKSADSAVRLSVVAYLRYGIWEKTRGKTQKFKQSHLAMLRRTLRRPKKGGASDDDSTAAATDTADI